MGRIHFFASEIVSKDLGEKHVSRRNVHVVADLHVLEVVLSSIPGVA
jgi:hypothetical protein